MNQVAFESSVYFIPESRRTNKKNIEHVPYSNTNTRYLGGFCFRQAKIHRFVSRIALSNEQRRERISNLIAGRKQVRSPRLHYTKEILALIRDISGEYTETKSLGEAYRHFGDLLTSWETLFTEDDIGQLTPAVQALLIRLGYALEDLERHSPAITFTQPSTYDDYPPGHTYFKHLEVLDYLCLSGHGDEVGCGYLDVKVLPTTLARVFGAVAFDVCPEEQYRSIRGGGRNRLFFKFPLHGEKQTGKYPRNRRVIQQLERCLSLVFLISNPGVWEGYSFEGDKVAIATLIGGLGKRGSVDTQVSHLDLPLGFPETYSSACSGLMYALACILSLYGCTHLLMEPFSWGCENEGDSIEYNVEPGHLLIFRGNFVHAGRAHSGLSIRVHWYRPLSWQYFDPKNIDLCS